MSKRQDRIERILVHLANVSSGSIDELAEKFRVSSMTIRRDLSLLESRGHVRLFRGGAVITESNVPTPYIGTPAAYALSQEYALHLDEKKRIGAFAATLVESGDVVFVDAGSTTEHVVRNLSPDIDVTVVCYSANSILPALERSRQNVILLGGTLKKESGIFASPEAVSLLGRTRITKAFFSARGVQPDLGVTCSGTCEIQVKQAAIKASLNRYLLVDSSKIGRVHSLHFADIGEFDLIVTNGPLREDARTGFAARDVPVHEV